MFLGALVMLVTIIWFVLITSVLVHAPHEDVGDAVFIVTVVTFLLFACWHTAINKLNEEPAHKTVTQVEKGKNNE